MIQEGDTFTIAGFYKTIANPHRRPWQVWKPKLVNGPELMRFVCTTHTEVELHGPSLLAQNNG